MNHPSQMPSPPLDLGSRTAGHPAPPAPPPPGSPHCRAPRIAQLPHCRAPRIAGRPALPSPAAPPDGGSRLGRRADRACAQHAFASPGGAGSRLLCLFYIVSHCFTSCVCLGPFVVSLYRCSLHLFPALPWDSRSPQTTLWPPCGRATGFGLGCGCVSGV